MVQKESNKFKPSLLRENRMNTQCRLNYYTSEAEKAFPCPKRPEKSVRMLVVYRTENYGKIALSGGKDRSDPEV